MSSMCAGVAGRSGIPASADAEGSPRLNRRRGGHRESGAGAHERAPEGRGGLEPPQGAAFLGYLPRQPQHGLALPLSYRTMAADVPHTPIPPASWTSRESNPGPADSRMRV